LVRSKLLVFSPWLYIKNTYIS